MEPLKILTFGLPKILQKIILESFSKQGSLQVIENFTSINEYLEKHYDEAPTVIIVESESCEDCERCPEVLRRYPEAHVVSVGIQGKSFSVWRMVYEKRELGEISSDELTDIIFSFGRELN